MDEIESRLIRLEKDGRTLRIKYYSLMIVLIAIMAVTTFTWGIAQVPNPGHSASSIGSGILPSGNYLIDGNLTVSNLTVRTYGVFNSNVSISGNITFPGNSLGFKQPFKQYNCTLLGSVAAGWTTETLTDANCSGDSGIPYDNSYCLIGANDIRSASGINYDWSCQNSGMSRYTASGPMGWTLRCDYLCW